jgi:23S rRNA (cytosine1962-C5)-methyltransferase
MRENRTYGSEGGEAQTNEPSLPLSIWTDYELLDFGAGRKLERFGQLRFDRPCPAAEGVSKARPGLWRQATARYNGQRASDGQWKLPSNGGEDLADEVAVRLQIHKERPSDASSFELLIAASPAGQVGVFPEQYPNWQWIARQTDRTQAQPLNVLNLFAYTGASTLAAAAAGAAVTHIDAAKQALQQARANDERSGLADRPIRWIVEDAVKFCRREVKRGNRYDAVILDPPSYGHGPQGEDWQIKRDLLPLLELCGELTERRPAFMLLSCHTPGIGPAELSAYMSDGVFGSCGQPPRVGQLQLETKDGRRLPSGVYARWPS